MPGINLIEAMYNSLRRHAVMLSVPFYLTETEHFDLCRSPCSICGAKAGKHKDYPYQVAVKRKQGGPLTKEAMVTYCHECFKKRQRGWLTKERKKISVEEHRAILKARVHLKPEEGK